MTTKFIDHLELATDDLLLLVFINFMKYQFSMPMLKVMLKSKLPLMCLLLWPGVAVDGAIVEGLWLEVVVDVLGLHSESLQRSCELQ